MTLPLLPTTERRLLEVVAARQASGRVPSLVAGVVRDGTLVWSLGRGRSVTAPAGPGDGAALPDADTQYKIGSVTKTMTAALVLLARERGEVALDDRLERFLPGGPYASATLRQLLSHAAGLTAEPHGSWWERSPGVDGAALLAAHADAAPVHEPGSRLHYSNLGYGLLGQVVERVTGQTWWDALRSQVLDPLGMTRTTYAHQRPHAAGFAVDALTGELVAEPLPDTGAMAPAGQLWSTVADLATWATALVDPARSVLAPGTLAAMRTPQSGGPDDTTGTTWGLGVTLAHADGRVSVGHGGSMPGFSCGVLADVPSRTGVVVLSNAAYGLGDLAARLLRTVVDAEPAVAQEWTPTLAPPLPADARDVLGPWHWGHAPSRARWDAGELLLEPVNGPGRTLRFARTGPDTYVGTAGYLAGEQLEVVRRADGTVSHLLAATFVFTRTPYDPAAPIPGG